MCVYVCMCVCVFPNSKCLKCVLERTSVCVLLFFFASGGNMSLCLAPVLLADRYNIKRHTHLESDPATDRGEGAGNKPTLPDKQAAIGSEGRMENWALLGSGRSAGVDGHAGEMRRQAMLSDVNTGLRREHWSTIMSGLIAVQA